MFNTTSMLEASARQLVAVLGGTWHSRGAMCRCPAHADSNPSLSVRLGASSLLFKCFAGCDTRDVIRAIRALRLEVPAGNPARLPSSGRSDPLSTRARELWESAHCIEHSLAERYLRARAIDRGSHALRFHPHTPLGSGRELVFRPALIAAVHEHRRLVAIQRIFLSDDPPSLARDLPRPKLALGRPLAGAVMLDNAGSILGLAEGVETALSAATLLRIPVWATLGNERLARIALPPKVDRLVLLPDADMPGRLAARRAAVAYARDGLSIETFWPRHRLNDWNDVLRWERETGRSGDGKRPEDQGEPHLVSDP